MESIWKVFWDIWGNPISPASPGHECLHNVRRILPKGQKNVQLVTPNGWSKNHEVTRSHNPLYAIHQGIEFATIDWTWLNAVPREKVRNPKLRRCKVVTEATRFDVFEICLKFKALGPLRSSMMNLIVTMVAGCNKKKIIVWFQDLGNDQAIWVWQPSWGRLGWKGKCSWGRWIRNWIFDDIWLMVSTLFQLIFLLYILPAFFRDLDIDASRLSKLFRHIYIITCR